MAYGQVQSPPPLGEGARALTLADWIAIAIRIAAPLVLIILVLADLIRPGSFKRAGLRDVAAYAWPVWLFGAFVVFSAQVFGSQTLSQLPMLWERAVSGELPVRSLPQSELRDTALRQLGAVLFGSFAGGVMVFLLNKREHDEGMRFGLRDIPIGCVALVLIFPLVSATAELSRLLFERVTGEPQGDIAHETLRLIHENANDPWAWVLIAAAVLGAAIVEELIYRAFVQTALLRLFGSAWLAVLVTGVGFGLVHRAGGMVPWHQIPTLVVLGVCIGLAYERFKGLGVPITIHAGFNAVQIALLLWVVEPPPADPAPPQDAPATAALLGPSADTSPMDWWHPAIHAGMPDSVASYRAVC